MQSVWMHLHQGQHSFIPSFKDLKTFLKDLLFFSYLSCTSFFITYLFLATTE